MQGFLLNSQCPLVYPPYFVSVTNYREDTLVFRGNSTAPIVSALVGTAGLNVSVEFVQSSMHVKPNINYHHIQFNRSARRNITKMRGDQFVFRENSTTTVRSASAKTVGMNAIYDFNLSTKLLRIILALT